MIKNLVRRYKAYQRKCVEHYLPKFCYRSAFMSSMYYFLFSSAFRRENKAVLAGKVKYMKEAQLEKANYSLLVRNIHRIEKGLLMRPRRPVFAKDYIKETIESYIGVLNKQSDNPPQVAWFTDVLDSYFETTGEDKIVTNAKELYTSFKKSLNGRLSNLECELVKIPYRRNDSLKPNISYEDFYKLNKYRRSVRWFLNKPVPRNLIDKAILVASQAPSACNRQPFEYYVVDNPELVKEAVKLPMGTTGYAHSIQTLIIVIGNLDSYFDERDRHLIYIDASLANMSLMLALETLGLGSVSINWPDIEDRERKMEKFLKLKSCQRPIMCLGIGYPDPEGMVAFSEKRDLNQIRKFL